MHGDPVGTDVARVLLASVATELMASPIAMRMHRQGR
jgi:hypothetical protein